MSGYTHSGGTTYNESDQFGALTGQSANETSAMTPLAVAAAGVRRLTPIECERLQALPDGWTDLGGTPDSRRYSALGDAVTATVGEWIGRRFVCNG